MYYFKNNGEAFPLVPETEKRFLMGNEAKSAVDFILNRDKAKDFLKECQEMNEKVLLCMEKMRVNNA